MFCSGWRWDGSASKPSRWRVSRLWTFLSVWRWAMGGFALAETLHLSAPLAVVAMGLLMSAQLQRKPIKAAALLTWGGLRGGISVALAFTLSGDMSRELIVHMTYAVVVFSILVQGLSLEGLVKRLQLGPGPKRANA